MKKCAWIRSDEGKGAGKCPFGLPITEACEHAGNSVAHMCPSQMVSEDKRETVEKANKRVYLYYKTDTKCMYASGIMKQQKAVNCDFGDTAAGMGAPAFSGSPLYPQSFSGIGLDGLYAFPLGFYADNNESRNLFQGLFSLVGEDKAHEIIKNSSIEDEVILKKLYNNESLTKDEQFEIINMVENCRQDYEDQTDSPDKVYELEKKWNPRTRG